VGTERFIRDFNGLGTCRTAQEGGLKNDVGGHGYVTATFVIIPCHTLPYANSGYFFCYPIFTQASM